LIDVFQEKYYDGGPAGLDITAVHTHEDILSREELTLHDQPAFRRKAGLSEHTEERLRLMRESIARARTFGHAFAPQPLPTREYTRKWQSRNVAHEDDPADLAAFLKANEEFQQLKEQERDAVANFEQVTGHTYYLQASRRFTSY
jgi:hypothetical protein